MSSQCDVLVVGAGPAGSTTAIAAKTANPELRIILVDKEAFPRDKVCGDGLGPGVVRVLRSLDALEVVEGALKPADVYVGGPRGYEGYAEGPTVRGRDLSGYVLPRRELDARLVAAARGRGVEVMERLTFLSSSLGPGQRTATFKGADGTQLVLSTRFLVGADGAYSRVRRDLGVPKQPKKFTHIASRGYGQYSDTRRGAAGSTALRIDFEQNLLPAYGWLFPVSIGEANVGIGIPIDLLKGNDSSLDQMLDSYLTALRRRGIQIDTLGQVKSHQLPHAAYIPPLVHDRAALVGDAGSMINSLSGEGIAYGMAAGEILGRLLAQPSTLDDPSAATAYETEFRKRFGVHLRSCWISHKLLRSPRWATMVIRAASRDQVVMDDAAQMLFDEQRMKLGTGLRIAARGF